MKIYLAQPISGRSFDSVVGTYEKMTDKLESWDYTVLCPMVAKGFLSAEQEFKACGYANPVSTNRAIIGRDRWMVRQSDVVFANLSEATRVSIGTVAELAWAYELGKHVIVVMEKDNIHQHAFVVEMADIIFETTLEALIYLEKLSFGRLR